MTRKDLNLPAAFKHRKSDRCGGDVVDLAEPRDLADRDEGFASLESTMYPPYGSSFLPRAHLPDFHGVLTKANDVAAIGRVLDAQKPSV